MKRSALWLSGGAALVAYAALIGVAQVLLLPETGGPLPFDLRIGGYDAVQAQIFIDAISAEGRAAYLGPVRLLDTVFPVVFGAFLSLLCRAALPKAGWPAVASLPILYVVLDLWENARVGAMIAQNDAALAAGASALTQAKFIVLAVVALVLGAVWLWRRVKEGSS